MGHEGTRRDRLKFKLVRAMVVMLGGVALALICLSVSVNVRTSRRSLLAIEAHHRETLAAKAQMLAEYQALALKGMVLDNSFGDVEKLIQRTAASDRDVVYGLFTSSDGRVWAFAGPGSPAEAPPPKAYEAIGLTEQELSVPKEMSRERRVFGEDVVEEAMPVRDGADNLGTLRYGLSTRRMQDALRDARAANTREMAEGIALFGGVALLAAAIAATLSSRAAAKIAMPIQDLAGAARALAGGNREVRVTIHSNDEVEELGDAFNQMVHDLKTSYDSLEELNKDLESKVENRTAELASRNRDMRLVLDHVEEGLLTLDARSVIALEHSAVLDRWFGTYGEQTTFSAYLGRISPEFSAYFELGWEAITDGFLPLDLCVDQLPKRITANDSVWDVKYTPLMVGGQLDGMLVVIQDVTEELLRRREDEAQREALAAFQRMMRDRAGFIAFHAEMSALIGQITSGQCDNDLPTLRRAIHTVKGNAAVFGLERISGMCHAMEDEMAETRHLPSKAAVETLGGAWRELTTALFSAEPDGGTSTIAVPRDDLQALARSLAQIPAAAHLARRVDAWRLEPIQVPLRRLADQAVALARRLGKGEIDVDIRADGIRCDPRRWAPLWSDLVHIVRNAVDHGLETEVQREAARKPRGAIRLGAAWEGDDLVVSIADNGRGIDFGAITEKAKAAGLPHETEQDLMEALFADGISTAQDVSDVSGRGVGLAAVRARVVSMGGRVIVTTATGRGTTWSFRFSRPVDPVVHMPSLSSPAA